MVTVYFDSSGRLLKGKQRKVNFANHFQSNLLVPNNIVETLANPDVADGGQEPERPGDHHHRPLHHTMVRV